MSESSPFPTLPMGRVLMVDRHLLRLDSIYQALEDLGFAKDVVLGGSEAVLAASVIKYDVILLDIPLGDMEGYVVCRWIRALEAGGHSHVPIIALVDDGNEHQDWPEIYVRCIMTGMDDCLACPFNFSAIYSALAIWTKRSLL